MTTLATTSEETGADLRRESGLTLQEIADKLASSIGRARMTHAAIIRLEEFGTGDIDKLEALARIFGHITPSGQPDITRVRNAYRKKSRGNCDN